MEIYHEQIYDLLAEDRNRSPLQVREHQTNGFYVEGCQRIPCASAKSAYRVVDTALRNRQVGSHNMNHRSNRSHFVIEMAVDLPAQKDPSTGQSLSLTGKISFVDLAGSERLRDTQSVGKTLQETGFINKSLYVLGKVISAVSRGKEVRGG